MFARFTISVHIDSGAGNSLQCGSAGGKMLAHVRPTDRRGTRLDCLGISAVTKLEERRRLLEAGLCTLLAACGGVTPAMNRGDPGPVPERNIDDAVAKLDRLVADLMASTGVPGMAVAVVRGGACATSRSTGSGNTTPTPTLA